MFYFLIDFYVESMKRARMENFIICIVTLNRNERKFRLLQYFFANMLLLVFLPLIVKVVIILGQHCYYFMLKH